MVGRIFMNVYYDLLHCNAVWTTGPLCRENLISQHDFHEIWYGRYVNGGYSTLVHFLLRLPNILVFTFSQFQSRIYLSVLTS
jgi:hypothetical protein